MIYKLKTFGFIAMHTILMLCITAAMMSFFSWYEGPDDSPQIFNSYTTKYDVTFTWSAPTITNGIITQYNLTVTTLNVNEEDLTQTTSYYISASVNQTSYSYRVTGFVPYQNYTATVRAATSAGYGPAIETSGRTKPHSGWCLLLPVNFLYLLTVEFPFFLHI